MYCTYHPTEQFSYYQGGKREGYTRPLALNRIAVMETTVRTARLARLKGGVPGGIRWRQNDS